MEVEYQDSEEDGANSNDYKDPGDDDVSVRGAIITDDEIVEVLMARGFPYNFLFVTILFIFIVD